MLTWLLAGSFGAVAGVALGVFFFGGLWLTATRLVDSDHPALLLAGSYLGRMAVLALSFYVLLRINQPTFFGAIVGFLASRLAATKRLGQGQPAASSGRRRGFHHG